MRHSMRTLGKSDDSDFYTQAMDALNRHRKQKAPTVASRGHSNAELTSLLSSVARPVESAVDQFMMSLCSKLIARKEGE